MAELRVRLHGRSPLRRDVPKPKLVGYLEDAYWKLRTSDVHETHNEAVDGIL